MLGSGDRKRKVPGTALMRHQPGGGGGVAQPMMMQLMPAIGAAAATGGGGGGGGPTSCVVFVAEVPPNTCELELKRVFQEFGKLERIITMPAKRHALVEFLRVADAEHLVAACQSGRPVTANGGTLSVSFSNRPRIDLDQEFHLSASPQTCLLLTFYNVRMEFNCESIRQICSPYGLMERCLLVRQQDGLLRAVVEFDKLEDAVLTKPNLNGANMYAGCNAIRCEYARHTAFEYFASRESVVEEYRYETAAALGKRPRMAMMQQQPPPLPPPPLPAHSDAIAAAAATLGAAGLLMQRQLQFQHHQQPQHQQQLLPQLPAMQQQQQQGGIDPCVIVIRGLSPQMNCDRLFNILALYGNVARIKFITTKEGFALVQMMDAPSAQQAVDFLHGQYILGSALKVTHSDQGPVKRGLKDFHLADGSPAEKAYDSAKMNRFMTQEAVAKNQASLGRTGRVLYYWGCPDGTTEASLRETLKLAGASDPQTVTQQGEKGSTGWISFASVNDATDAICLANHWPMGEMAKLKLSYAVNKK